MTVSTRILVFMLAQTALLAMGADSGAAPAAPGAAAKAPPRLEIAPAGRIALGSIGPRECKTLAYTFSNRSATPITVHLADLSPGVKAWGPALDAPIAAGQSLGLTLSVDPSDFVGAQVRAIRLVTDDPQQGEYRLPLSMDVRPDLSVDKPSRDFGAIASHESPQVVFTFTRETGLATVIRPLQPLPAYLETEVVSSGGVSRLEVTFRPARVQPGATMGMETLQVETNAPKQPRFTLYLHWRLQDSIEARPSRMVFLDATTTQLQLQLKAADGKPFMLQQASVEGAGFQVGPLPATRGSQQTLTIARTASALARAVLILRFQGQEQPLRVPLAYLPGK